MIVCIQQTPVFMQKEDCGLSRNSILETNGREVENYKKALECTHYQIVSEEEQEDGFIIVRIRKQYNGKADVAEYFQQALSIPSEIPELVM